VELPFRCGQMSVRKRSCERVTSYCSLTVGCGFNSVIGRDAKALKETLADNGIMVRYYSKPERLAGCIRISVGKPEQTAAIKAVLESL
jgi:histidinol-phosphate/aromatic aminotransferase/cobyric acid decarboxylase-like protein